MHNQDEQGKEYLILTTTGPVGRPLAYDRRQKWAKKIERQGNMVETKKKHLR